MMAKTAELKEYLRIQLWIIRKYVKMFLENYNINT